MSRHEVYYQQRIVPCECGSLEPYWHGPTDGARTYCCDECWEKLKARKTKKVASHERA